MTPPPHLLKSRSQAFSFVSWAAPYPRAVYPAPCLLNPVGLWVGRSWCWGQGGQMSWFNDLKLEVT